MNNKLLVDIIERIVSKLDSLAYSVDLQGGRDDSLVGFDSDMVKLRGLVGELEDSLET